MSQEVLNAAETQARAKAEALLPEDLGAAAMALKPFNAATAGDWFVGRTGYTGEDGFEVILPGNQAAASSALRKA